MKMVFKLVRTDTEEPCKIRLQPGVHLIGRGKFLDCDDKRVSRKHGQLEVTEDDVSLKALHQNPCFYIKKGTDKTVVLKQDNTVSLTNGDKFGLLPDSIWYEVMLCNVDVANDEDNTEKLDDLGIDNCQNYNLQSTTTTIVGDISEEEELLKVDINETLTVGRVESPSLLPAETDVFSKEKAAEPNISSKDNEDAVPDQSMKIAPPVKQNSTENDRESNTNKALETNEDRQSPKRSHSPEDGCSNVDAKKVKIEPEVKQENESDSAPQPGPSGDQGSTSNANDGDNNVKPGTSPPPSPAKPNAPLRERCMYGANCYRKNPSHKAQFAHPSDADWGGGTRGVCPWGGGCVKRDPRHWRDHDHPPGTVPPPPRAPDGPYPKPGRTGKVKRQRNDSDSANSDDDSLQSSLIVTGKRTRKTVRRQSWTDSEEERDPYGTDESDEWTPGSDINTQSQTQDF